MTKAGKSYILLASPVLVENGKSINIESDIYAHYKNSLEFLGRKIEVACFNIAEDGQISLDVKHLSRLINENSTSIILIDGNFSPGDKGGAYPVELLNILEHAKNPKIAFLPDLFASPLDRYLSWVSVCNIIIGFHLPAVEWANNHYETNKFVYSPSLPIPPLKRESFSDFLNRPYDFGYIGSSKGFRMAFIDRLDQLNQGKFKALIAANVQRGSSSIVTNKAYMNSLAQCKYVFVTRASLYEEFPTNFLRFGKKRILTNGRFAGRTSEALAAGSIPLYWEQKPLKTYLETKLLRLRYTSRKLRSIRPLLLRRSGALNGWPYDQRCNEFKSGIATIRDPEEGVMVITESIEMKQLRWLNGKHLYRHYAEPEVFFNQIENLLVANCEYLDN